MDLITDYRIPFLHPLMVHFPLVLLLLGAGAAGMYLLFGRAVWRQAGLVLFVLGTVSAWMAEETGHALEHAVEGDPIVEEVVARGERSRGVRVRARLGRARPDAPASSADAVRRGGGGRRGPAASAPASARAAVGTASRPDPRRAGGGGRRVDGAFRRDHGVGSPPIA